MSKLLDPSEAIALVGLTVLLFHFLYNFPLLKSVKRISVVICFATLGLWWGQLNAQRLLDAKLPLPQDKRLFVINGQISGLVNQQANRLSFNFVIHSFKKYPENSSSNYNPHLLKKLRLSFYYKVGSLPEINAGEHWQFLVRLRSPRGLVNFSGFDYMGWLVENNISATGYIVSSHLNKVLSESPCSQLCIINRYISQTRQHIQSFIFTSNLSDRNKAIISALTIGDKSKLDPWWPEISRFGIVHLLVISGLHIGLVATLGFLLGGFISRIIQLMGCFFTGFNRLIIIRLIAPLSSMFFAFFYTLLAGFSLPTQRALIVVCFLMLCKIFSLRLPAYVAFFWAIILIAVMQPMAVIGASFWLSFSAVAILLFFFLPRIYLRGNNHQLVLSQWVLFVGMAAPLYFFMGKLSLLSPLVNLLAVPLISIITVPLCLFAALMIFISQPLGHLLWRWAGYSIDGLWYFFELLPNQWGFLNLSIPSTYLLTFCIVIATFGFLLPKGLISRWLLIIPFALHLVAHKPRIPLRITVLDVGQGLAVVVESRSKALVYDTGTSYGDSFDMGSAVVAPFLSGRGFTQIDRVVISHGDRDHSGGLEGLNRLLPARETLLTPGFFSQAFYHYPYDGLKSLCDSRKRWRWEFENSLSKTEWIYFDILLPKLESNGAASEDSNNNSCVLLIRWRDISILLPGDIERRAEQLLLENYQLSPVDVLVAPHHGSKTSSGRNFIEQLKPAHVVFSSGFRHHFGHPHPDVVARYRRFGSKLWITADNGAVTFEWNDSGDMRVLTANQARLPFWWR